MQIKRDINLNVFRNPNSWTLDHHDHYDHHGYLPAINLSNTTTHYGFEAGDGPHKLQSLLEAIDIMFTNSVARGPRSLLSTHQPVYAAPKVVKTNNYVQRTWEFVILWMEFQRFPGVGMIQFSLHSNLPCGSALA